MIRGLTYGRGLKEVLPLRAECRKVFDVGEGHYRAVLKDRPLHMKRGDLWEDIDAGLVKRGNIWETINTPHQIAISEDLSTAVLYFDGRETELKLDQIGGKKPRLSKSATTKENNDEVLDSPHALEGLGLELRSRPKGIELYRIIDKGGPLVFDWQLRGLEDPVQTNVDATSGIDRYRRREESRFLQIEHQRLGHGRVKETVTGQRFDADKTTRIRHVGGPVEYPLLVDATLTIGASADDGYWAGGYWQSGGNSEYFFQSPRRWALRFLSSPIGGTGSHTVTTATLRLFQTGNASCYATENMVIAGSDVVNAAAWGSGTQPGSPTMTTARSGGYDLNNYESSGSGWNIEADVKSIIQELQGGWSGTGNAIRLMQDAAPSASCKPSFEAYDAAGTNEPELVIEFDVAGGGSIPVFMHHYTKNLG